MTSRGELKNAYNDIINMLPGYAGYFSEYGEKGYYSEDSQKLDFKYGIATFVRKDFNQSFLGGITLYNLDTKWNDYSGNFAAGAAMAVKVERYSIINIHGLWQGSIKNDTEAKIKQSEKILDFAKNIDGLKIICGDFNLLPDTKSIKLFRDKYQDLILDYRVTDTRGSLYAKDSRYSDYVFADGNISIKNFYSSDVKVSDHLPLVIEFS